MIEKTLKLCDPLVWDYVYNDVRHCSDSAILEELDAIDWIDMADYLPDGLLKDETFKHVPQYLEDVMAAPDLQPLHKAIIFYLAYLYSHDRFPASLERLHKALVDFGCVRGIISAELSRFGGVYNSSFDISFIPTDNDLEDYFLIILDPTFVSQYECTWKIGDPGNMYWKVEEALFHLLEREEFREVQPRLEFADSLRLKVKASAIQYSFRQTVCGFRDLVNQLSRNNVINEILYAEKEKRHEED